MHLINRRIQMGSSMAGAVAKLPLLWRSNIRRLLSSWFAESSNIAKLLTQTLLCHILIEIGSIAQRPLAIARSVL